VISPKDQHVDSSEDLARRICEIHEQCIRDSLRICGWSDWWLDHAPDWLKKRRLEWQKITTVYVFYVATQPIGRVVRVILAARAPKPTPEPTK
jgi:hypothetical protein